MNGEAHLRELTAVLMDREEMCGICSEILLERSQIRREGNTSALRRPKSEQSRFLSWASGSMMG